jgi:hypothetical protein
MAQEIPIVRSAEIGTWDDMAGRDNDKVVPTLKEEYLR